MKLKPLKQGTARITKCRASEYRLEHRCPSRHHQQEMRTFRLPSQCAMQSPISCSSGCGCWRSILKAILTISLTSLPSFQCRQLSIVLHPSAPSRFSMVQQPRRRHCVRRLPAFGLARHSFAMRGVMAGRNSLRLLCYSVQESLVVSRMACECFQQSATLFA